MSITRARGAVVAEKGTPQAGKYLAPLGGYDAAGLVSANYSGKILLSRAVVSGVLSVAALAFSVGTAVAGKVGRVGVYADNNGKPGALLYDAGTASIATVGTKEVALPVSLAAGVYWLAFLTDATVTAVLGAAVGSYLVGDVGVVPDGLGSSKVGYSGAQAYDALPVALPALAPVLTSAAVFVKGA